MQVVWASQQITGGEPPGPTLDALTLDDTSIFAGVPVTINILGATTGSAITGSVPSGLTLNSGARTITGIATAQGSYNFDLIETLAGSPNSPRTNPITLTVYSPAALGTKLREWLDFNDFAVMFQNTAGTTPVTAAGQRVARINDKAAGGNTAIQATTAAQPILRLDAGNGTFYGEFDGLDDRLVASVTGLGNVFYRITVAQQISWTLNDQLWGMAVSTSPELRQAPVSPELRVVATGLPVTSNNQMPVGTTAIIVEKLQGLPTIEASLQINNGAPVVTTSASNYSPPTDMSLGARTGGTLAGNFRVYETVTTDDLTAGELTDLKNYFAARYGITI